MDIIDLPQLKEDQLFFDICACYGEMMLFPENYIVNDVMFNNNRLKVVTDFPSHLNVLSRKLQDIEFSPDHFIDHHTTFPAYQPFLSQRKASLIREYMKTNKPDAVYPSLGLGASGIHHPLYLRYCPCCAQYERDNLNGSFWHRTHQFPNLNICNIHKCWLEESHISTQELYEYISAERALPGELPAPRVLNLKNKDELILLKLTQDVVWLLNNPQFVDPDTLHHKYFACLAEQGLATYSGTLRIKRLTRSFSAQFSSTLLRKLDCTLEDRHNRNWLTRWLEKNQVNHPLRHLLIITLLGYSAEDFFRLPSKQEPFGAPPWPCLNYVCHHYKQNVIQEVVLGFSRKANRKPLGTFLCPYCDFSYSRVGPDALEEDRFRIGQVRYYGALWEDTLLQLLQVNQGNINAVAREMRCAWDTVKRHAERLENENQLKLANSGEQYGRLPTQENIADYRDKWSQAKKENPEANVIELQKLVPDIFRWLDRHDAAWLEANKPIRKQIRKSRVNWQKRDISISSQLFTTVEKIRGNRTLAQRITLNSIAHQMGYSDVIFRRDLRNLPRTLGIIPYVLETTEEFACRRIFDVAKMYQRKSTHPTPSQLIKAAGVSRSMQTRKVQQIIQTICDGRNNE